MTQGRRLDGRDPAPLRSGPPADPTRESAKCDTCGRSEARVDDEDRGRNRLWAADEILREYRNEDGTSEKLCYPCANGDMLEPATPLPEWTGRYRVVSVDTGPRYWSITLEPVDGRKLRKP